jgi:predicted aconitase
MLLTREEEKGLSGEYGEAVASAYRILVAIGEATDADKLIPIQWAHVSGVNYNTIGDSGLEFLKQISLDGKAKVRMTINPMGFDRENLPNLSQEFIEKQIQIVQSYEKMGAIPTFSCIPYEIMSLPISGTQVSFAESNAAVLANSHLEMLTNKESALSALASAITGKSPYSDLRIEENRTPQAEIKNEVELKDELEYGLLGYFTGKNVKKNCAGLRQVPERMSMWEIKSLSAGIGTSGSCGMFRVGDNPKQVERIEFGKKEMKNTYEELSTADDGEIITFGSPQLGMDELTKIQILMNGKKFSKPCKIFCPRSVYHKGEKLGLTKSLERSGASFVCDACTCLTPLICKKDYDSIITNSVKAAYYMKTSNKVSVKLSSLKSIVDNYTC